MAYEAAVGDGKLPSDRGRDLNGRGLIASLALVIASSKRVRWRAPLRAGDDDVVQVAGEPAAGTTDRGATGGVRYSERRMIAGVRPQGGNYAATGIETAVSAQVKA